MGATPMQIITKVMLPESVPSLVSNFTIAITTVLGYSAMSGIIGGGGLGKIAINYGYYRYMYLVMMVAVIFLIVTLVWLGVNIFWALSNKNCIFDLIVAVLFALAGAGMVYNECHKRKCRHLDEVNRHQIP